MLPQNRPDKRQAIQVTTKIHNQRGTELFTELEGVDVLMGLGLSNRQARVYLSLLKTGSAKVQTIASPSAVHRQEMYRLLDSLMQIGLVRRNITTPTTYTPTPVEESIKMLLEQKTNKLNTITKQAKQLTKKLKTNNPTTPIIDIKPCFGIVFEADRGRKYRKAIKMTQNSMLAVTSWNRFKQLSIHFENQLIAALKKDLTLQIITEKPPAYNLPKWVTTASKAPNFELKTIPQTPQTGIAIFDHTQAAIAFSPNSSLTKGPELWTTTPTIITLCQTYFNTLWANNTEAI
ncbi:MAG: hypothetical protein LBQ98_06955 [Nitrososphaerota archaeon]|jgi:sugar-specific transcriptional regulator TrmB|nr:hypothetical protein [Nitrososphaerota archaeon]